MSRRILIAALALVGLARPVAAQQPEDVDAAKAYFEAGRQAYESGQYGPAITAFEEAYKASPRPAILFSLAQAYRRQYTIDSDPRKLKRAVELYQQYLAEVPKGGRRDDATQYVGELRPVLEKIEEEKRKQGKGAVEAMQPAAAETQIMVISRTKGASAVIDDGKPQELPATVTTTKGKHKIKVTAVGHFPAEVEGLAVEGRLVVVPVNLREQPARIALRAPGGAEVAVDGRPVGETPLGRSLEVPAGRRFVTLSKRGHHPFSRELVLQRGQELKLDAGLEKTTQRKISYYFLGGAGAVLIGGGVTTLLAFRAEGKAQDILDKRDQDDMNLSEEERADYESWREQRDRFTTWSYVLYGSGVALAATGILLYLIDNPRAENPPPSTTVSPEVTPDGLGVSLRGFF